MKLRMKRLLVSALFSIFLAGFAWADLAGRIDGIINRASQKKVRFAVQVIKADSGRAVYSHNSRKAMVPASNMKIIISAAALKYLGPDYEYKTKVGLCGDTLVIIGSGDPLLGDEVTDAKYGREKGWIFEDIAAKLKQNGIKAIKDIIVDTNVFDDVRVHPSWPEKDLNKWYACEVSGLNYNDNCIDITVKNTGGRMSIIVEPETDYVKIINDVVPITNGRSVVGSYRQSEINNIVVHGKCKEQMEPFPVAIERPAAFFGFLLAENLIKAGINTEGKLIEKTLSRDSNFKSLVEYSTPITDCLGRCNKNSLGLAAECLLKTIAAESRAGRKNGSWSDGREVISRYLLGLGIKSGEFYIDDGSGLSRKNKLSSNAITKVLFDVYKSKSRQIYKETLAVGGEDGTIRRYFKEDRYRGKIFGKTGYIAGVKSFSGICSSRGGDYIFSILTEKANGRTRGAVNDIAKAIIDDMDTQ